MKKKKPHRRKVVIKKHQLMLANWDWLLRATGQDCKWWVAKVQALIVRHSRPTKDPWHSTTATRKMIVDLTREVERTAPKKTRFEVNMRMASVLSLVLATWYLRIHRAKSYDPRRPVALRKQAYFQRFGYAMALFRAMEDESLDQEHFPGQRWETPFDPYPTDGYFV